MPSVPPIPRHPHRVRVAIVGGGLAGLAAAAALCEAGLSVELFESRRRLGGRAASFRDPHSGEVIDHCQHVSMGCCTNLADFCRRTGLAELFRRDRTLHFFGPDGRRCDFTASRWLPAPLHLAPALWRLSYLSNREKLGIARTLGKLARLPRRGQPAGHEPTIGEWLRQRGQSPRVIELFWSVVLVSALGESLDRASLEYARQVFVDGFLSHRTAYEIEVPTVPLGELYGQRLEDWLRARGVGLHLGCGATKVRGTAEHATTLELTDGSSQPFDCLVVAVPWGRCAHLFTEPLEANLPLLSKLNQIEASPITGVHLWFDRPVMSLDHAVLVGRLSQWIFRRDSPQASDDEHYYQVVISASRELTGRNREDIVQQICEELRSVWPAARAAVLLKWRMVSDPSAVFSARPGIDELRPPQRTPIANLMLAGDWTATGWPATMEGAVRSGYLAAEAVLAACGRPRSILVPDLPRSLLVRLAGRRHATP